MSPRLVAYDELIYNLNKGYYHTNLLPNMKRVDLKDLASSKLGVYSPTQEWKVIPILAPEGDVMSCTVWLYYDGTGIVFWNGWDKNFANSGWKNDRVVRFYTFSICEHEYTRTQLLGNCLRQYECGKCGHKEVVDSSD